MKAGRLTEIIDIYRDQGITNDYGERNEFWNKIYTTRANVSWDSGSRDIENAEIFHNYTKTFTMYPYVDVKDDDRIFWQKHFYRILSIERRREANMCLVRAELVNE